MFAGAAPAAPLSTTPPVLTEVEALVVDRPGWAFATTADTLAVAASAPTIDHLVTRDMRESPSSRRETGFMYSPCPDGPKGQGRQRQRLCQVTCGAALLRQYPVDRRSVGRHSCGVLTAVVRARCLEALDTSASTRLGDDDVTRSAAGVRS
jgi:hypothetical protein